MRSLPILIDYVSPSACETFCDCPRKWAWPKLEGKPKRQSKAAETGSAVHEQHENWLRDGIPYDRTTRAGEIAAATLHLLPDPGVATIEQEICFTVVTLRGAVVLGGKLDGHWNEQGLPVVLDHKTCGDLAWAKDTKEALIQHPQAPIYARWAMGWYGSEWTQLRWNYATTKGRPKPLASWHVVHESEIMPAVYAAADVAHDILDLIRATNEGRITSAMQIEPNPSACGNFGGCEYRPLCTDLPVY
jgi:hypothetical protein